MPPRSLKRARLNIAVDFFNQRTAAETILGQRAKGIEPSPPAWKAGALPLSYTRKSSTRLSLTRNSSDSPAQMMAGAGFEPAKAEPPDLQSGPFGRSGIPPICPLATLPRTDWNETFTSREAVIAHPAPIWYFTDLEIHSDLRKQSFDECPIHSREQFKASGGI